MESVNSYSSISVDENNFVKNKDQGTTNFAVYKYDPNRIQENCSSNGGSRNFNVLKDLRLKVLDKQKGFQLKN